VAGCAHGLEVLPAIDLPRVFELPSRDDVIYFDFARFQWRSSAGSVLDVEMAILDKQSKGVAIDEQANDDVVHLYRLREADRLAD